LHTTRIRVVGAGTLDRSLSWTGDMVDAIVDNKFPGTTPPFTYGAQYVCLLAETRVAWRVIMSKEAMPQGDGIQKSTIDSRMQEFRIASRELFNNFFSASVRFSDTRSAWDIGEDFKHVERALFNSLVLSPESIFDSNYGVENKYIYMLGQKLNLTAEFRRTLIDL
jgi:hypothetical protein